jgi:hypothetical protein
LRAAPRHGGGRGRLTQRVEQEGKERAGHRPGHSSLLPFHFRMSSEIPTFDAIFSIAASVLFRVLAMIGRGCFLAASVGSLRNSPSVQRTATPSGIPKFEAFFFVESRLRLSLRAITAADNLWLARTLNWRISSLVQMRGLKDFLFVRPVFDLCAMFTLALALSAARAARR